LWSHIGSGIKEEGNEEVGDGGERKRRRIMFYREFSPHSVDIGRH
jgi:hypothetical protein